MPPGRIVGALADVQYENALMALSLALACSFAVYFSSQTKAIDWPVCVAASGHICRAPTAIMTGENRSMARPYPNLTAYGHFDGADGCSGHYLTGRRDRHRALDVSSHELRFRDKV